MTQPTQTLNQFFQKPAKGCIEAIPNPTTLTVQLSPTSSNTLYPGDAVQLVSGASNLIQVNLCTLVSDQTIGFVIFNTKKTSFAAGAMLEIAMEQTVIFLQAYGSIARGQKVEWYPTGREVQQSAGKNAAVGTALDSAYATGDLIRVKLGMTDAYSSSSSSSCSSSSSLSSSSSSCRSSSSSSSCRSSSSSSCLSSSSSRSSSSSSCRSSSSSSSAGA